MKLQSAQFAEVFCELRDNAKPYTQQDAADLAKIREPMPPSASLIKRIKRHAEGVVHRNPVVVRPARPECDLADFQRANYYKLIAELGGSRTIKPCDKGLGANVRLEAGMHFIAHPMNSECVKPRPVESDAEKLQKEGERLKRLHHTAMLKSGLRPHDLPADLVLSL